LASSERNEAIATLFSHAGWIHLQDSIEDNLDSCYKRLETADPTDSIGIAKIQTEIRVLRNIINKPQDARKVLNKK